jgi:hypothetical protein
MIPEQKDLLLKDLCARLPYKTAVSVCGIPFHWDYRKFIDDTRHFKSYLNDILRGDIKPYLFPLSSMTKEQESYIHFNTKFRITRFGNIDVKIDEDDNYFNVDEDDWLNLFDWLNKNHFDYRGLIEKGLAIDATNLNIY